MTSRLIAVLQSGETLMVEFPDEQQAQSELNRIERFRAAGCTMPEIFWRTIDGQAWCLSIEDFAQWPRMVEPTPA